jgi:hypothetical protein
MLTPFPPLRRCSLSSIPLVTLQALWVLCVFLFSLSHELNGFEFFRFNSSASRSFFCAPPSSILKMIIISSKSPSLYSKYLTFIPFVYMLYVVVFSYLRFPSTMLPLPNLNWLHHTPVLSLARFHRLPQSCPHLLWEFTQHLPHQPCRIRVFGCPQVLP